MEEKRNPSTQTIHLILHRIEPLAFYILVFLPLLFVKPNVHVAINFFNNPLQLLEHISLNLALIIVILSSISKSKEFTFHQIGFKKPTLDQIKITFYGFFLLFCTSILMSILFSTLYPDKIVPKEPVSSPLLYLMIIPTLMVGAYMEEIFFRAYLYHHFKQWMNPKLAIFISTMLFASGHLYQGEPALIATFILGLIFSLTYLKSHNIHLVAFMHAIYNLLSLFFL